jgi:serine/threonine protein kinase/tetratricopeptide (TPR) repeat protein
VSTLGPERWREASPYLDQALSVPESERAAWLEWFRTERPDLVDLVQELLEEHQALNQAQFLERPPVQSAMVGQNIGAYTLTSPIGQGGMGSVWLAQRSDGRFERKVAIKFIRLAVLDVAAAERFKREGAILGKLSHPQIAELIDAGLTPTGEPFLVLEYVEGWPIDEFCDNNKLSVDARIRLFLDVLSAVAHAHSNLIVHRDIKPSNVFIRNDAQVKLLDFGIAKVLADETNVGGATLFTLEGGAALTPLYAAPEQLSEGTVTTATDIYALGVLLYLLLTGRHPAGPGPHSAMQLVRTIVDQEPPRASDAILSATTDVAANRGTTQEKLIRQLKGDLDRIIAKALKKNPAERYSSATAFADDLRRYLEHEPVLARPDSLGYRTAKFVRRNRVAVAVGAMAFIAAVAGVAAIMIQARRARAERDFAYRQLMRIEQHDDFLDFLLSDAAPSGKPFTVNDLLGRAEHIVERQKASPAQIELFDWIGDDYSSQDQDALARPILEHAYQLSRQSSDIGIRASAACALGGALSRDEEVARGDALIQEGLRELPDDPQYALNRVDCLRQGSFVSREKGEASEAVQRMEMAHSILRASPFGSDEFEMEFALDLGAMYSLAGRDREALAEFQRADALMSSLGRDETQTAIVLYNGWALELDQVGRPLEAEKNYRRAIDISRDNSTEEAVSPMVLNNYANVQRQLDHLPVAEDYAERAYNKATQTSDELVINQSLLERARIYIAQHDLPRAEAMLAQVEPRLRKELPPGHYAFASIFSGRALIALEKHDPATAQRLMDEAITTVQAAVHAGGAGSFSLPGLYIDRSAIDLALGHADQAEVDAGRAVAALQPASHPGDVSSKLGRAYLSQARALAMEGKSAQARAAASQALVQLQGSVGPDHPDTQGARQLAQSN